MILIEYFKFYHLLEASEDSLGSPLEQMMQGGKLLFDLIQSWLMVKSYSFLSGRLYCAIHGSNSFTMHKTPLPLTVSYSNIQHLLVPYILLGYEEVVKIS